MTRVKNGLVILVILALFGVAACSARPEGVTEEKVANYISAVASIGCELKYDSDYIPVEFQAGLTREENLEITAYMLSTDRAVRLPDGGVKLTTGACA